MLDVTHVPSGKRAYHCPWMLVDSDRSMIAGREILGFPKKLGAFSFAVDGVELSAAASEDSSDDAANATRRFRYPFRAGATVAATVSRGGVKLLDASGTLSAPAPKNTKAFSETNDEKTQRVAFLNAQTNHPIPGTSSEKKKQTDPACVSNRPRLVQFAFDETPATETNAAWTVRGVTLTLNQTKTDAIVAPFAGDAPEVVAATLLVTNLYTGSEPTPTTGEEVPPGYVENDDVYWLRYQ